MAKFKICERCQEKDRNTLKLYTCLCDDLEYVRNRVLGDDYYNMGMDAWSCNKLLCRDITKAYERMKNDRDFWRGLTIVFGIFTVTLIILLFSCGGV